MLAFDARGNTKSPIIIKNIFLFLVQEIRVGFWQKTDGRKSISGANAAVIPIL